jgi:hypothetical protein
MFRLGKTWNMSSTQYRAPEHAHISNVAIGAKSHSTVGFTIHRKSRRAFRDQKNKLNTSHPSLEITITI